MRRVIPLAEKPSGFIEVDVSLFYGEIILGDGLSSIKGMSGGPIFTFQQNEEGEMRYWLIALQSRWLPKSHFIAACPTKLLGNFIEEVINNQGEK